MFKKSLRFGSAIMLGFIGLSSGLNAEYGAFPDGEYQKSCTECTSIFNQDPRGTLLFCGSCDNGEDGRVQSNKLLLKPGWETGQAQENICNIKGQLEYRSVCPPLYVCTTDIRGWYNSESMKKHCKSACNDKEVVWGRHDTKHCPGHQIECKCAS
jgi:hypothetical protein